MKITEHFSYEELRRSDTATRLGIENTPPSNVKAAAADAAGGMEKIRALLGTRIQITSWYRSEALERLLTKKDFEGWCFRHGKNIGTLELLDAAWKEYFSRKGHPTGYCVDFVAPTFGSPRQIVKAVKGSGIKFDQIIEEGTWVHVSFDPRMRGEVLTATFKDGAPTYTHGLT